MTYPRSITVTILGTLVGLVLSASGCAGGAALTTSLGPNTSVAASTTEATSTSLSSTTTVALAAELSVPEDGYVAIVGAFDADKPDAETKAQELASQIRRDRIEAGVLLSSDYATLPFGDWVAFVGHGSYEEALALRTSMNDRGYADVAVWEVTNVTSLQRETLEELRGKTYLPIVGSVPGGVSNIQLSKDVGQQYYSFKSLYQGHPFLVTVGPSNFFEGPFDEGEPDMSHTVDIIVSAVKTPDGMDSRVVVYSETAPRRMLELFAGSLNIPGRQ
jgi:hypothetical protein